MPRHASARDWFQMGFYAALGVVVLGALAWATWQFSTAALAVAAPFVVGLMFALLLDPLADRLERRGLRRMGAVGIVFGLFLLLLVGFGVAVVPALVDQAKQLQASGPAALVTIKGDVNAWLTHHKQFGGVKMPKNFDTLSAQLTARASDYLAQSSGGIQGLLTGTVTTIINTVITLIVAFFLLSDIDRLRARFFFLLPDKSRAPMEQIGRDVGGVFTDYLRGLLVVCAFYGLCTILVLYGLSFTPGHGALAGYALLVGTLAGVLYAIPYVGSLTTALITFLVAFAAGGPGFGLWAVGGTVIINQVFDNIVTPRVIGGGVGLNPVIAIFALILGAEMFHIWGMLLSVPIAASIQVILFRVFPKLTVPTPAPFLRAQGVPRDQVQAAKVAAGDHPTVPEGPSELHPESLPPLAEDPAALPPSRSAGAVPGEAEEVEDREAAASK